MPCRLWVVFGPVFFEEPVLGPGIEVEFYGPVSMANLLLQLTDFRHRLPFILGRVVPQVRCLTVGEIDWIGPIESYDLADLRGSFCAEPEGPGRSH